MLHRRLPAESAIYNFDGKLILALFQKRKDVTDCVVHPPGIPDDEQRDPLHRVEWVSFVGEYDPQKEAVYVHEFRAEAGDAQRVRGLDQGTNWREKVTGYYYSIRQPFNCNARY